MAIRTAIIGGTGVYDPKILHNVRDEAVSTAFGDVACKVGEYNGKEVAFLPRHGAGHTVPPHLINYRANILALKRLGVRQIIATAAVGSINKAMKPGDFVIVDQFLDFTKARASTFFEGQGDPPVVHTDFTKPYCPEISALLVKAAEELGLSYTPNGVYVCTEGPRFETPAEIRMYAQLGGDLVGMTNVPEVVLAREAEICYATVAMVTNFAAGISPTNLTHAEVLEVMARNTENLKKLAMRAIDLLPPGGERSCGAGCHQALAEFGGFKLHER